MNSEKLKEIADILLAPTGEQEVFDTTSADEDKDLYDRMPPPTPSNSEPWFDDDDEDEEEEWEYQTEYDEWANEMEYVENASLLEDARSTLEAILEDHCIHDDEHRYWPSDRRRIEDLIEQINDLANQLYGYTEDYRSNPENW